MAKKVAVPARGKQVLSRWYEAQLLDNVTVLRGSFIGWLFGRFGQHAVTINRKVHLTPHAPELDADAGIVLLGHECCHVVQQTEMGWLGFLARYLWRWRPSHVREGWKHPLEEPAYARGREISEALRN